MSMRNEKISAYLDDEIHQDEIMSFSLSAEEGDAAVSTHYRLIGDILRGEQTELSLLDVSDAVRQALAEENLFDEPVPHTAARSAQTARLAEPSLAGVLNRLTSGWLKPLAGMAVAASVAVVMVLVVMQNNIQSSTGGQMASAQAIPATTVTAQRTVQAVPVSANLAANQRLHGDQQNNQPASNSELNAYLNQHFATQDTLQSRMPYVRAVSYESAE